MPGSEQNGSLSKTGDTLPSNQPLLSIRLEEAIGATAIGLSFLITFANVIVRYLSDFSFAFTEEFSVFLLFFLTFIGASLAVAKDRHIRMEALVKLLHPRQQVILACLGLVFGIALFGAVLWYGSVLAHDDYRWQNQSSGLGLPLWIYTIWIPILSTLILYRMVERMWRYLSAADK